MSSEEQNKAEEKPSQIQQETYYQRKKNWIGGIDNDTLLLLGVASAIGLGAIAATPIIRDFWTSFTSRMQNQQPQLQQPYIPPTAPTPAITNGHGNEQNQQIPVEQPIEPTIKPQEPAPQQPRIEEIDEDDDGVFYEKELKRKQQLMGRRPTGSKYESPFGKDIGGLG